MEKGTAKIAGYEFEDEDVILDFTRFEQCGFKNCNIIYHGFGPYGLVSCMFDDNCRWSFGGPAQNVLNFLKLMYHGNEEGGRSLAENTFQAIRNHDPTAHPNSQV